MESTRVGCFDCTGCLITMFPNNVHNSKIKPQGMPIGSFTVPKVGENDEQDEDNEPMDEESNALDEELRIINDEGGEEYEMEDEEHKEDNGTTVDDNPDDV